VNSQIYVTSAQHSLYLGCEKALAANFGQGAVEFTVTPGGVDLDLCSQVWPCGPQCSRYKVGLPTSQLTGARAQDQRALSKDLVN
jgi:hypothetical protein